MKILIYGLGHIGGSLALGIKKYYKDLYEISFIDKDKKTIKSARKQMLRSGDLPGTPFENDSIRSADIIFICICLLYTSPSPRDRTRSRMPSSA